MIQETGLDQFKADFWLTAAHRLKTPLTLLRVVVGILQESDKWEPQQRELVDRAAQAVKHLEYEVSSLLEFLRVQSGALELNLEPTDVEALLERALSEVQTTARGRHQDLKVVLEPGLPPVRVDQEAIRKVLVNLLDNACKHTPEGGKVTIQAQRTEQGVTIWVKDTGRGVPEEERTHIFEAYYRRKGTPAPATAHQGIVGTGLGLAIARSLLETHGSIIWLQDHQGGGAWFAFNLPLTEGAGQGK